MLYRLIQEDKFPAPYRVSSSGSRWSDRAIAAWIDEVHDGFEGKRRKISLWRLTGPEVISRGISNEAALCEALVELLEEKLEAKPADDTYLESIHSIRSSADYRS